MEGLEATDSIDSPNAYYKTRLRSALNKLTNTKAFLPNRHLIPIIDRYIENQLSQVALVNPGTAFVFTHYDLSPRNILVTGDRITGIVDFEFSGFFSPVEEFLNDYVNNGGDWPSDVYVEYQRRLEQHHVPTPTGTMDGKLWANNYWLEKMTTCLAPWWLPGPFAGQQLENELQKAAEIVTMALSGPTLIPEYGKE